MLQVQPRECVAGFFLELVEERGVNGVEVGFIAGEGFVYLAVLIDDVC